MDSDQLITEAENFSPVKAGNNHPNIAETISDDFKKIPHGLSHKHAVRQSPNRRNSTSSIRTALSVINSSSSPTKYKDTYTCPRTSIGKTVIGLNGIRKRNLDQKLKKATANEDIEEESNDKENSFVTPSRSQAYQRQSLLHTPSLSSKRGSSDQTGSAKRLKSHSPVLKTPLRPTEAVAASPSNEQNSRIVDSSRLLLDTGKSPHDSSALNSPLANVSHANSSHIAYGSEGIEEVDAQTMLAENSLQEVDEEEEDHAMLKGAPASDSSFAQQHDDDVAESTTDHVANENTDACQAADAKSMTLAPLEVDSPQFNEVDAAEDSDFDPTIASPMSKPTFTLRQIEELQRDRALEVQKLEELLSAKDGSISSLRESVTELNNNVHNLNSKLIRIEVENGKLTESNKVLYIRLTSQERASITLEKQLKHKEHKLSQFLEAQDKALQSFAEMESNIAELQAELKKEKENNSLLNSQLENSTTSFQFELDSKSAEIIELKNQLEQKINEVKDSNTQNISLTQQLQDALDEIKDLTEFKDDLENANQASNEKINDQENEIGSLTEKLENVLQDYKLKALQADEQRQEISELHNLVESQISQIDNRDQDLERLKNELEEEKKVTGQFYKELEEEREASNSKSSEIAELRTLNEDLEVQLKKIDSNFNELRENYFNQSEILGDYKQEVTNLTKQLDESAKSESGKVEELRNDIKYLEEELSHSKASLRKEAAKSEEIQNDNKRLNDRLQKKEAQTETLHQKVEQLEEELSAQEKAAKIKVDELVADLYVQYSKKHEKKVSILKSTYESKYNNRFKELGEEKSELLRRVESLKAQLSHEREEKAQLVKIVDQFTEMENSKSL